MPSNPVRAVRLEYLDGERVEPNGASATLNVPTRCNYIELRPESEDMYWTLDGTAASAAAPGYIVAGGGEVIGPLCGLPLDVRVFQAAGGYVHVMYFKEHTAW